METARTCVRRLTEADTILWRAIRLEALKNAPEAFGQTWEQANNQPIEQFRKAVSGSNPIFSAFVDEKIVGTAGFYVMDGPKFAHRGMLWGMYVTPEYRKCGIGSDLVDAVVDHARRCVQQVHLTVVSSNVAAYALYRRKGFTAYGVEPRALRYEGRDYDETLMVRLLDMI